MPIPLKTQSLVQGTVFEVIIVVSVPTKSTERLVAWALVALVAGCAAPEDPDPCKLHGPPPEGCFATYATVGVHWSFETLSGDSKASCLPGSPDVTVSANRLQGEYPVGTLPCAGGQAQMTIRTDALLHVIVSSITDHTYRGAIELVNVPITSGDDLPTVVIYTDVGDLSVLFHIKNAMGTDTRCEMTAVRRLRVFLDGAVMREDDCSAFDNGNHMYYTNFNPAYVGTHTVSVEALDSALNVIATSAPVDVTVLAAAIASAELVLQL